MERVIKFSLPSYINLFDDNSSLASTAICICYQYNVNSNGYGPYGYNTELSKVFLEHTFGDVQFWDRNKCVPVRPFDSKNKGIYFYKGSRKLDMKIKEVNTYKLAERKNELRIRTGADPISLHRPLLLNIIDHNGLYKSEVLNQLIDEGIPFFLRQNYTPEAGDTLITFEQGIAERINEFVTDREINFLEVDNIDALNPW